jgi:hypothetical protein
MKQRQMRNATGLLRSAVVGDPIADKQALKTHVAAPPAVLPIRKLSNHFFRVRLSLIGRAAR